MNTAPVQLRAAPIVEAVVDIDCDLPAATDVDALDAAAVAALADGYPLARRRVVSEHEIVAPPDGSLKVSSRQGQLLLQYLAADERQVVQFRPNGFSFNRPRPTRRLTITSPKSSGPGACSSTWRSPSCVERFACATSTGYDFR